MTCQTFDLVPGTASAKTDKNVLKIYSSLTTDQEFSISIISAICILLGAFSLGLWQMAFERFSPERTHVWTYNWAAFFRAFLYFPRLFGLVKVAESLQ